MSDKEEPPTSSKPMQNKTQSMEGVIPPRNLRDSELLQSNQSIIEVDSTIIDEEK